MANLREKQKEKRLRRIRDASFKLFEENGFNATTMEHIAEAAEVSVGTLYNYFASKPDLLSYGFSSVMAETVEEIEMMIGTLTGSPAERINFYSMTAFRNIPFGKELYRELYAGFLTNSDKMEQTASDLIEYSNQLIFKILENCVADGQLSEEINLTEAANTITVLLIGFEIFYYMDVITDLDSLEKKMYEALEILFRGLQGEKK